MADDLITGSSELALHLRVHLDDQAVTERDGAQETILDVELYDIPEVSEWDAVGDQRDVRDRRTRRTWRR